MLTDGQLSRRSGKTRLPPHKCFFKIKVGLFCLAKISAFFKHNTSSSHHHKASDEKQTITMAGSNGANGNGSNARVGTDRVKQGLAQMLKGGVIVSFTNGFLRSSSESVQMAANYDQMKRAFVVSFSGVLIDFLAKSRMRQRESVNFLSVERPSPSFLFSNPW
jgi:hypothetical protein